MELITTDREDAFGKLPTRMRFQISRCESVSLSCAWLLTFPTSLSLIVCWWGVLASTVGHYRAPRQRTHSMSLIRRRITFHPRHPNPSLTWGRCCGCFISRSLIRPPIQEADKRPLPEEREGGIERKICRRWPTRHVPSGSGVNWTSKKRPRSAGCGQQAKGCSTVMTPRGGWPSRANPPPSDNH